MINSRWYDRFVGEVYQVSMQGSGGEATEGILVETINPGFIAGSSGTMHIMNAGFGGGVIRGKERSNPEKDEVRQRVESMLLRNRLDALTVCNLVMVPRQGMRSKQGKQVGRSRREKRIL